MCWLRRARTTSAARRRRSSRRSPDLELPPETSTIAIAVRSQRCRRSFSSFGYGLAMAVVLLYLVMVAQFRSFLDPFIIMFAVPMGLIGVVWTLLLTGTTLNIESFMGIIAMVGIVVSNAILLVDFANQRLPRWRRTARRRSSSLRESGCARS